MLEKKLDTGEVVCGFLVRKDYEGQKDFDQTYKEVTIKKRVKKIGEGEEDFIIEEFEEVKEIPIKEVLAAQAEDVGIEAYMRPYDLAGQPLPDVRVGDDVLDVSQFPEDPADVMKVGDQMMANFYGLDPLLRGDAKTPEEFLNSITDEKLKAYYEAKLNAGKKEVKEDDK